MFRILATAAVCAILGGFGGGIASAKSCRDAHGKFVKCPPTTMATKHCRDAKGKFTKCTSSAKKM